MGFKVFAVNHDSKTPVFKDWQFSATDDVTLIEKGWKPEHNVGIFTGSFKDGALLVVDVDNKKAKCGDDTVFMLELEGFEFPQTFEVVTPTGGRHLF
jgi:hypothetical protein